MKKSLVLIISLLLFGMAAFPVSAAVPYDSYTYSTQSGTMEAVHCPTPYYPAFTIDKNSIGVPLSSPNAMCFDKEGNLYIADTDGNKIVVLDKDYKLKKVIEEFETEDGLGDFLSAPEGVFVADNMDIYICDTGNLRILVLDQEYKLKRTYQDIVPVGGNVQSADEYQFAPTKVIADESGNMFILVKNEYQGIVQVDQEGHFISFLGSNKVTYNPIEKLWKKIMTKEQKAQMQDFLPVEYSNLSFDEEGLINTVAKSAETSPIKKLNLSGKDVLIRNGYVNVTGDFFADPQKERSQFVDIVSDENGTIYALDAYKGRIFVYDTEGFLYYVFGSIGQGLGSFLNPTDIELRGSDILVADRGNPRITVFKRTKYAELISDAAKLYNEGRFDESIAQWNEVIKLNSNFELAYAQIGKVMVRKNEFEKAMEYFEMGNYRGDTITKSTGYNKAFAEYRRETASKWLPIFVISLVVLFVVIKLARYLIRRKKNEREN